MQSERQNVLRNGIAILREEGPREFLSRLLSFFIFKLGFLFLPFAILKIKYLNEFSLNNLIRFSSHSVFSININPSQIHYEVLELLKILNEKKPEVIVEIGTANGGTLFLFTRVASPEAKIISIDLPSDDGGYPKWKTPLYKAFSLSKQELHLLRADSHNKKTLEKVKKILKGYKVDFLFIDGDHSYEGVKKDFEMYKELVKDDGLIAFHDIVPDYSTRYGKPTTSYTGGVPIFWNEIKSNYRYKEIIEDQDQDGYGVGILESVKE